MGATAGLFVKGLDGDDADLTVDDGRGDFEGPEEIGVGVELGFREEAGTEGMVAGQDGVDLGFECGAEGRGEAFPLEVDAGVGDVDLGAGDPGAVVLEGDGIENVEDGVIAGEGLAAGGVDAKSDGEAGGERGVGGVMPKDVAGIGEDLGDGEDYAVRKRQGAMVAGLAAAAGVEAGLVEGDGIFAHGEDGGGSFVAMVVEPVQAPRGGEHAP